MLIKHTTDLKTLIYRDSLAIRQAVFVQEQHVPSELEVDAFESVCTYFVAYQNQHPVATLRLLPERDYFLVQRVAVVQNARHQGLGQALMITAEKWAAQSTTPKLLLHAQVQAADFYTKLGYVATATPKFEEAGIWHQEMAKIL